MGNGNRRFQADYFQRSGKLAYCIQSYCTANVFLIISKAMLSHLLLPRLKVFLLIWKFQQMISMVEMNTLVVFSSSLDTFR